VIVFPPLHPIAAARPLSGKQWFIHTHFVAMPAANTAQPKLRMNIWQPINLTTCSRWSTPSLFKISDKQSVLYKKGAYISPSSANEK
jgi:hypothetical protein